MGENSFRSKFSAEQKRLAKRPLAEPAVLASSADVKAWAKAKTTVVLQSAFPSTKDRHFVCLILRKGETDVLAFGDSPKWYDLEKGLSFVVKATDQARVVLPKVDEEDEEETEEEEG